MVTNKLKIKVNNQMINMDYLALIKMYYSKNQEIKDYLFIMVICLIMNRMEVNNKINLGIVLIMVYLAHLIQIHLKNKDLSLNYKKSLILLV